MAKKKDIPHPWPKKIHHPRPKNQGDEVTVLRHFAAFGFAETACAIHATLTSAGGDVFHGKTVQHPDPFGFWIVHFCLDKPPDLTVAYTLEAFDITNGQPVRFDKVPKIKLKDLGFGIVITYPLSTDTVCSTFSAYGTTDGSGQMGGVMYNSMLTGFQGTIVQGPPDWIISFQNLADGDYTLCIGQVGETAATEGVTVARSACS